MATKEASKTNKDAAVKRLQAQREAQAVTNEEAMERMDSTQPLQRRRKTIWLGSALLSRRRSPMAAGRPSSPRRSLPTFRSATT